MPTYEYDCGACGAALEIFQSIKADPLVECPECREPALRRRIGRGAGVIFKGGGFYETDYKRSASSSSSGGEGSGGAGGSTSSGSTPASSAPAKPAAAAPAPSSGA